MADMYHAVMEAVRTHLSEQAGVQAFLCAGSTASARRRIFLYEYTLNPTGSPAIDGAFIMLERGQNWSMNRERLSGQRHFSKTGSIELYVNYPLDGEPQDSGASEELLATAWADLSRLMEAVDSAPRIAHAPAAIHIDQVDLSEWWRPTADDAESDGDRIEAVFSLQYGTGA